jgi:hypothetical protein
MKKSIVFLFSALYLVMTPVHICGQTKDSWHFPLYLHNLGYWHERIPVVIRNTSRRDLACEPVRIPVGKGKDHLDLAGFEAGEIRLIDSNGTGLLLKITSGSDDPLTEGKIPEGSTFILPAAVRSGETITYYIYYDNPDAWPVGAFLEGNPSGGRRWMHRLVFSPAGDSLKIEIKPSEKLTLKTLNTDNGWPEDRNLDIRFPVKILNFSYKNENRLPVYTKMDQVYQRASYKGYDKGTVILSGKRVTRFSRLSNALLFENNTPPLSEYRLYAYFSKSSSLNNSGESSGIDEWYSDTRNLLIGKYSDKDHKSADSTWRMDIPVVPGKTYMFGAMVRSNNPGHRTGIRLNCLAPDGKKTMGGFESNFTETEDDWTYLSGIFKAPEGTGTARMSLILENSQAVFLKNLIMMEVLEGYASSSRIDQKYNGEKDNIAAWPVNPIIKVFREDIPPGSIPEASISAARNETEPLQIALRSERIYKNIKIKIIAPQNKSGEKLDSVKAFLVGYVPVDYPSNYYEKKVPYWYLKYPDEPGGSDGWAGFWPDPLLPPLSFDLEPGRTQPVWIELFIPKGTGSGNYTGRIILSSNDEIIKEIPWTVTVYDFTLPDRNSFGALFDYRSPQAMPQPGPTFFRKDITPDSLRNLFVSFMAKHRICPGEIDPVPDVKYHDGKVEIDFTEYDKAATIYFDELKNPFAYLPTRLFYLFGWAFPPSEKFGENPYPGNYPYEDADRGRLRPEYKKAYQAVLRTFWEHLREKGWADRYILYLSDEPHNEENGNADIVAQMKALCNMIHEVDPGIPVYVSTWWYRPEWDGYIDIWGLGFNGEGDYNRKVTIADLKHITSTGGRIWYTIDGHFCTETPYMALERLLPWFGFKFGAEAYEFWGVNWLTYNPYRYGWHSYIFESQSPGKESWKRYPNGDGFIIYPGKPIGLNELTASIRIKQIREGAEDYEYLNLLRELVERSPAENQELTKAKKALQEATDMVNIPCAMGRYSTRILRDPDKLMVIREHIAAGIEALSRK